MSMLHRIATTARASRLALRAAAAAIAALVLLAPAARSAETVGVVLLHGKWAPGPAIFDTLDAGLERAGYLVRMPVMPWSSERLYDASFENALDEIDKTVAALKQAGATRIAVGGQSLGANAALAYGARHPGLLAILAISPGHRPEERRNPATADSLARARTMLANGQGNQTASFVDLNQGRTRSIDMTAAIYLSYWDPRGAAVMPPNAAKLSSPLLWIIGEDDPLAARGAAYAYDQAPADPRSRYIVVESGAHTTVAKIAADQILAWLNAVRDSH
jgi:pimeloyl-ACP methyl ester carboxylesterase